MRPAVAWPFEGPCKAAELNSFVNQVPPWFTCMAIYIAPPLLSGCLLGSFLPRLPPLSPLGLRCLLMLLMYALVYSLGVGVLRVPLPPLPFLGVGPPCALRLGRCGQSEAQSE